MDLNSRRDKDNAKSSAIEHNRTILLIVMMLELKLRSYPPAREKYWWLSLLYPSLRIQSCRRAPCLAH